MLRIPVYFWSVCWGMTRDGKPISLTNLIRDAALIHKYREKQGQ